MDIASPVLLDDDLLRKMHAWWRAANYLNVGQIYLQANPLLRLIENAGALAEKCVVLLTEHETYTRAYFDDLPEIKDWVWSES